MAQGLRIPTVTSDDLSAFHARVYGSAALEQSLPDATQLQSTHDEEEQEEDDLGYYPDGVKRTLTDEQIAMFRNSEIYAIIRARQVAAENREADANDSHVSELEKEQFESNCAAEHEDDGAIPSQSKTEAQREEKLINDTIESEEGKSEIGTIRAQDGKWSRNVKDIHDDAKIGRKSSIPAKALSATVPNGQGLSHVKDNDQVDGSNLVVTPQGKKRNRPGDEDIDEVNRSRKSRSFVRELDSAVVDDQVLDYGDESSTTMGVTSDATATAQPSPKGKKIWWPSIGE